MLCISTQSHAQDQEKIGKFIITEATLNGNDLTQWYFDRKQFIVFYKNKAQQLCMANVSGINDDQSYGTLSSFKQEKIKETDKTYKIDIFNFRWKYYNTYDNNTGYATIVFTKVYKPQGVLFTIKMVQANLDVLNLKGYMEGSLNLNDYLTQ